MNPVTTVGSLVEADYSKPFVIHHYMPEVKEEHFVQYLSNHFQSTVFGYNIHNETIENLKIGELYGEWVCNELIYKILDAPINLLSLDPMLQEKQCLVMTNAPGYTALHVDPPKHGGGWMWLVCGKKTWTFVDLVDGMKHLFVIEGQTLIDLSDHPLSLIVPTYQITTQAGDFIYFPPGWLHRVVTHEKSLGLGGYLINDYTDTHTATVILAKHGLENIWSSF